MRPTLPFKRFDPGPKNGPPAKEHGSNGQMPPATAKTFPGSRKGTNGTRAAILTSEASAILRDQLLAELDKLGLKDDLDAWTLQAWPRANTLTPADGDKVREAFQARLTRLQSTLDADLPPAEPGQPAANDETRSRIDKSVLALPEPKRIRDKQHLRFVAKQPCLVCGREPSDPHHLRFAQPRGLGTKGQR